MISCIVQRQGRDCFCSTLLSLSCLLFIKVNKPRRETEQELRIWPSDVPAQLDPMPRRVVPRNTAPSQMKSLGGAFGLRDCWGTRITALMAVEILCPAPLQQEVQIMGTDLYQVQDAEDSQPHANAELLWRPTERVFTVERVVVLESCSMQAVKMKQSAIKPTWMVIYKQTCPANSATKG